MRWLARIAPNEDWSVSTITATLRSLPFTQLRQNRYFYLYYDSFYLVICGGLLAVFLASGAQPLVQQWHDWYWAVLPAVVYGQILCSVFIHNATHGNFPKAINRVVGELCGVVVLTRFASWEVIHQRHHRYSDQRDMDPHPIEPSYWRFVWTIIGSVEHQLRQQYYDLFGDTAENRSYERKRAYLSYVTNVVLIALWYAVLGPIGFFFFFLPASVIGFLHLVHFNWSTHNPWAKDAQFGPCNLDEGIYWWGNRVFFGIYYHANHHKQAFLFNPMRAKQCLPMTKPGVQQV